MNSNVLEYAFLRAVTALGGLSQKAVCWLPLSECASVLAVLPDTETLSGLRLLLAERLRSSLSAAKIGQDDAYDVYAALTALWEYDPSYVAAEWLVTAIRRLVQSEAAEGGPYYVGDTIALAPNVQIAIFLSLVATKPLPNMKRFIGSAAVGRLFNDEELASFALLYLFAAVYGCEELVCYVENNWRRVQWQTPWHKVIALDILKNRIPHSEIKRTLLEICEKQRQDGFWPAEVSVDDVRQNCGSVVTTALITRALYDHAGSHARATLARQEQQRWNIAHATAEVFAGRAEPLRSSALAAANKICSADYNFEITLLPRFFADALVSPRPFTDTQYTILGLANVCIWVAYTIYDDFIDDEGRPMDLPVANVAMRASMDCFRAVLPGDANFHEYVRDVLDGMDEANAWEAAHCRFVVQGSGIEITKLPQYGNRSLLAARAFAHALAPMALLALYPESAPKRAHIEKAFRHYLIARQLNDDLHDWAEDLQAGQISYVVTAILRDMQIRPGGYELEALLSIMRRRFRRTTAPKVCQRMQRHIALARRHFIKSQLLCPSNEMYALLDRLESSASETVDQCVKCQALTGARRITLF